MNFFSELVAHQYIQVYEAGYEVSEVISSIEYSHKRLQKAIGDYRCHGEIRELWAISINEVKIIFDLLGRFIGCVATYQEIAHKQLDELFASIENISAKWRQVVRSLVDELYVLKSNEKLESLKFDRLENIIQEGFQASGLFPKDTEKGLYIDVPFMN